jgi:hypothetical protein
MRSGQRVALWIYDYPSLHKSVEERHADIVRGMSKLDAPLGWHGLTPPEAPIRKKGSLGSFYGLKYPGTRISHAGSYHIRDPKYLCDDKTCDDHFAFEFKSRDSSLDYKVALHVQFPAVVTAIGGYRAVVYFDSYASRYDGVHENERQGLRERGDIDVDGRNNIFALGPAHYWSANLCQRALGYGRDEVIKRLSGMVPLVKPLMDGVYIVFNDNPDLTFEEFCAVNDRFKPILGLV